MNFKINLNTKYVQIKNKNFNLVLIITLICLANLTLFILSCAANKFL